MPPMAWPVHRDNALPSEIKAGALGEIDGIKSRGHHACMAFQFRQKALNLRLIEQIVAYHQRITADVIEIPIQTYRARLKDFGQTMTEGHCYAVFTGSFPTGRVIPTGAHRLIPQPLPAQALFGFGSIPVGRAMLGKRSRSPADRQPSPANGCVGDPSRNTVSRRRSTTQNSGSSGPGRSG